MAPLRSSFTLATLSSCALAVALFTGRANLFCADEFGFVADLALWALVGVTTAFPTGASFTDLVFAAEVICCARLRRVWQLGRSARERLKSERKYTKKMAARRTLGEKVLAILFLAI